MKMLEMEKYAQQNGFDRLEFKFTDLSGIERKGKWLDAFFGLFNIEGIDGLIRSSDWLEHVGDIIDFDIIE